MGVAKEAGQQNLTEDKVPWAELKELATNNLEIIVSVSDATLYSGQRLSHRLKYSGPSKRGTQYNQKYYTVVREIFVVKKFRTHGCVRKLNARIFSSQYIKYACYYSKGSPVRKFLTRKFPELW